MKIEPTIFSLNEHSQFLDTIQDELRHFRERQAEASSLQEMRQVSSILFLSIALFNGGKKSNRERILFQEWQDSKKVSSHNTNESLEGKPINHLGLIKTI